MLVSFGSSLFALDFLREMKIWEENWPAVLCPHVCSCGLSSQSVFPLSSHVKFKLRQIDLIPVCLHFTGLKTKQTVK